MPAATPTTAPKLLTVATLVFDDDHGVLVAGFVVALKLTFDPTQIDDDPVEGSADELLDTVRDDLEHLKGCYEELIRAADEDGHLEISNYAQDQVLDIAKSLWMLDSTLD